MQQREYRGAIDLKPIASLLRMTVAEVARFMDDDTLDPQRDFGLWENSAGILAGAALISPRTGWFMFSLADGISDDDGHQVFHWALTRLQEMARRKQTKITATVQCSDIETLKQNLLPQAGFWPITPTQYSMVQHVEQMEHSVSNTSLPISYHMRSLDPTNDFRAYQDLVLTTFGYTLDVVHWESIVRPYNVSTVISTVTSGKEIFVAACRGIIRDEESEIGARKGLIADLGTRLEFRRQGLGKAVLQACIRQLWEQRVVEISLDTDNLGAKVLYEAVGFTTTHQWRIYTRDFQV